MNFRKQRLKISQQINDRSRLIFKSFGKDMGEILTVIGEKSDGLFCVEAEIFYDDKYKKFQERFGLFGIGSVVNFVDVNFG
jgi:hypothetical protein